MFVFNKRDLGAGVIFVACGLAAMGLSRDYAMGTAARMGPGYFSIVLGGLLALLGLAITVRALRDPAVASLGIAWRPLLVLAGSVALFALLIKLAGLALCTFAVVILSRLAKHGYSWSKTMLLALLLSAFCSVVFYYGLGLQLPLWPWSN